MPCHNTPSIATLPRPFPPPRLAMRVPLLAMAWLAALLAVAEPDHTGPMREGSRKNGALMHLSSKHVVSILKGTAAQRPFTSHASLDGDSEEDDEDGDGDDTEAKDRNGHRKKRGWVYVSLGREGRLRATPSHLTHTSSHPPLGS